jgi:hypothetical protein
MDFTKAQLKAINHLTGNLQLIACAGSGKTEVGARRIVALGEGIGVSPGIYGDYSVFTGPWVRHHESGRGDLWADLVRNDFYRRVAEDAEDWLFYLAVPCTTRDAWWQALNLTWFRERPPNKNHSLKPKAVCFTCCSHESRTSICSGR